MDIRIYNFTNANTNIANAHSDKITRFFEKIVAKLAT